MSETRSAHVVVLHQHDEVEARERIELLESVTSAFYMLFAGQGVELRVPRQRLMSAFFAEHEDYLAFLHAEGADGFSTTRGYFHPTRNAVVAYDSRSDRRNRNEREQLLARRDELTRQESALKAMPTRALARVRLGEGPERTVSRSEVSRTIDRLKGELNTHLTLLELDRRAVDLGTAAHEMVHLLVANSGLIPRHDSIPIWLHEGLASQFEVVRGGRWAGISRAHDLRLPDWRRIRPLPRLEPLLRDVGFGHGYSRDRYAEAWALVYYLRTQEPTGFLTFLDLLRSPGDRGAPARPVAERSREAFIRAFGEDLEGRELAWRRFLGSIQTPLEQNEPKSGRS
jgi:hypothetical protein